MVEMTAVMMAPALEKLWGKMMALEMVEMRAESLVSQLVQPMVRMTA